MVFEPERMAATKVAVPAELNELSRCVIAAAIEVHRHLGPGLREQMYERALIAELTLRGLRADRQVPFSVCFKGADLGQQIVDLVVADGLIVECKAVSAVTEVDEAQLLGYLRFTGLPIGLLINFHRSKLKDGIVRRINWPPRAALGEIVKPRPARSACSVPSP
ncbi:MAG: GxxExxY protein [Phycisphaeraceae bacterium]|nr:GxxExxY protein [Phycisphaeraceae bacterium]